ncbi:hypothetical protein [Paenibacillus hexagrammi]|uniref:Uncharacterized protein n=1 Tax=Paenibacillus hexagrammi TaxID=2908839 RepID=A0ABY3SKH8_9BACL|nr:hypothetical protein [Paenibacillus sp. YPD9-1]UJF34466.1 hypothetical protein L0M14_04540 [Paenibacillus sp. YPD9-1]
MSESDVTVCPWCQTDIVWDPEIGPEEECPHCFNELNDYRSIQLTVKQTGQPLRFEDASEEEDVEELEDDDAFMAWELEEEPLDRYGEVVQSMMDEQEVAPECSSCHEFMLLSGQETITQPTFAPHISKSLGKSFIEGPFSLNVYICPSCFKVERTLSEQDRIRMVDTIKEDTTEPESA